MSLGSWALLAAWLCLSAMIWVEVRAEIRTGADYLVADEASPLRGKRIGLITNPTGVTRDLESLPLKLRQRKDFELVALYGPEHGVRGNAQAGDKVGKAFIPPQKNFLGVPQWAEAAQMFEVTQMQLIEDTIRKP